MADEPVRIPIERELDLHAFAPRDIPSVVHEYIDAAAAAGLREVRLVHGRGRGVQRGIVQAALERHAKVVEFWDDHDSHLGATVARLLQIRNADSHGIVSSRPLQAGRRSRNQAQIRAGSFGHVALRQLRSWRTQSDPKPKPLRRPCRHDPCATNGVSTTPNRPASKRSSAAFCPTKTTTRGAGIVFAPERRGVHSLAVSS